MKKNLIYMVGALLSSTILTFGCSEDEVQSYREVTVDKNEIFIQADGENPTAEVSITEGNGNYKITVADENIATAVVDGIHITFTGLKNGTTTATVMDWTKHSTVITVKVKEDFDLILDKDELVMVRTINPTEEVSIISGNGGYQVESSDSEVATAELAPEGQVLITALTEGIITVTVTDADGNKAPIKVTVCEQLLELEDISERVWKTGETSTFNIISGNGEYTVSSDNEEIATTTIDGNAVSITGVTAGDAIITITDKMGLSATTTVKVRAGLAIETTSIAKLMIGTSQKINITDGSGDYSWEISNESMTCSLSEDNTQLIINGNKSAISQTITLTDNVFEESVTINVAFIDYPFDTYFARGYIGDSFFFPPASEFTTKGDSPCLKMGEWYKPILSSGYYRNGYALHFGNGLEIGEKGNGTLSKLDNSGNEENTVTVTDVEIVKAEEITGEGKGKFWIKFHEPNKEEYSYIVTWT